MGPALDSPTQPQVIDTGRYGGMPTRVGSVQFTLFAEDVRNLLCGPVADRAGLSRRVVERLRHTTAPSRYIDELLAVSVARGGPDGLDLAIDVLGRLGDAVSDYLLESLDHGTLCLEGGNPLPDRAEDRWYVPARSLARTRTGDPFTQKVLLLLGLRGTTRGIREATVHALGDLGGPEAIGWLQRVAATDPDESVRASAREVLEDLEG